MLGIAKTFKRSTFRRPVFPARNQFRDEVFLSSVILLSTLNKVQKTVLRNLGPIFRKIKIVQREPRTTNITLNPTTHHHTGVNSTTPGWRAPASRDNVVLGFSTPGRQGSGILPPPPPPLDNKASKITILCDFENLEGADPRSLAPRREELKDFTTP